VPIFQVPPPYGFTGKPDIRQQKEGPVLKIFTRKIPQGIVGRLGIVPKAEVAKT
jgi:hypothetical protein